MTNVPTTGPGNFFGGDAWARRGEGDGRTSAIDTRLATAETTLALKNLRVLDTDGAENPATTAYVLQAGSAVGSSDGSGDFAITYPTAFSIATIWVVACQGDITGNELLVYPHVYATTGFTIRCNHSITGAAWVSAGPFRFNWIALGY